MVYVCVYRVRGAEDAVHDVEFVGGGDVGHHEGGWRRVARQRGEERQPALPELSERQVILSLFVQ